VARVAVVAEAAVGVAVVAEARAIDAT
jgi:hypothetical protein